MTKCEQIAAHRLQPKEIQAVSSSSYPLHMHAALLRYPLFIPSAPLRPSCPAISSYTRGYSPIVSCPHCLHVVRIGSVLGPTLGLVLGPALGSGFGSGFVCTSSRTLKPTTPRCFHHSVAFQLQTIKGFIPHRSKDYVLYDLVVALWW